MKTMHPDFIAKRMITEKSGAIFSRKAFPGAHVSRVEFSRGAENGSSFFMLFCLAFAGSLPNLTSNISRSILGWIYPIFDKEKTLCPTRT